MELKKNIYSLRKGTMDNNGHHGYLHGAPRHVYDTPSTVA